MDSAVHQQQMHTAEFNMFDHINKNNKTNESVSVLTGGGGKSSDHNETICNTMAMNNSSFNSQMRGAPAPAKTT